MGVAINRMDHTSPELRGLAAKSRDTAQARRMLAIAMVLEGASRLDAITAIRSVTPMISRITFHRRVNAYDESVSGTAGRLTRKPESITIPT